MKKSSELNELQIQNVLSCYAIVLSQIWQIKSKI